jgi:hypothetical protein
MIKTVGVRYTLNIVVLDNNGNAVASQTTPPFSVATGKIFKLNFQVLVTSSTGGSVFAPSPKIALVDRGTNLVTEGMSAYMYVYMSIYINMNTYIYIIICVHLYIYIYIYMFIYLYI